MSIIKSNMSKRNINQSWQIFPGAHTPLTIDRNIIVDGILASCYAFYDHDLAHIGMLPIQFFPTVTDRIFGGSSTYVNMAEEIGSWVLPADFFWKQSNLH